MAAWTLAISLASPSMASLRITAGTPSRSDISAAASNDLAAEAITRTSFREKY